MLLGGSSGDFGIALYLIIIRRLDRSFLMISCLLHLFGVIVDVVGSFLGMLGLKTRI